METSLSKTKNRHSRAASDRAARCWGAALSSKDFLTFHRSVTLTFSRADEYS
jgi:hypothetical protein